MAAQKVALNNTNITAEVFDLAHYEDLKEQYQIMSVPCMIVNDDKGIFRKKRNTGAGGYLGRIFSML